MGTEVSVDNVIVTTNGTSGKRIQQADASINTAGQALAINADNSTLSVGADTDFTLYHDGSDTHLRNSVGRLRVRNTGDDISLEKDTSLTGSLIVTGDVTIGGTLSGGSPLKIGGEVQFTAAGDGVAFNFGPNQEAKLFYAEENTNAFVLSGSSTGGIVLSGSALNVQTTSGIGVGVPPASVTHAITLPNNDDATGAVKANTFITYSSARYKKDVEILKSPMDTLNQINGVSFKWKKTDRLDYGFIAEDVGRILPNVVSWEKNNKDAQGMSYLKIISFLVEAVKEQNQRINKLEEELRQKSHD